MSFQNKFKSQIQVMRKGGIKSINNSRPINPINNNNLNIQKQMNYNNSQKNNSNININNTNNYQYIEFKPYSYEESKNISKNPIVMGPLGANIGTKEWKEQKKRSIKRENYSHKVIQYHKGIKKLKLDNPQEENERNYKKQLKKSKWYKGSEYCKIVQINNVYSENNIKPNLKDSKYYNDFGRINQNKNSNPYSNNYEPNKDNDIKTDIHSLIKENEICRQKIESIKESLL